MNLPEQKNTNKGILQSWFRIGLFYFIGFSLFFIVSFLIIKVRVSTRTKVEMPSLVGKLYLNEHNRLSNMGFNVQIVDASKLEYDYGYILAQNIPAGTVVQSGSTLVLLVNKSKHIVPVPELVGTSESLLGKMLEDIPVGKNTFSLSIGFVSRIPSKKPKGDILAQNPPAGVTVRPDAPVSVLISSGEEENGLSLKPESFQGLPIEILKKIAHELKVPLQIIAQNTFNVNENGKVQSIKAFQLNGRTIWKTIILINDLSSGEDDIYPNNIVLVDTSFRKNTTDDFTIAEYQEKTGLYENYAYYVDSKKIPVYIRQKSKLGLWAGFVEQQNLTKEIKFTDKKLTTTKKEDKPLFSKEQNESQADIIIEPDSELTLESIQL